MRYAWWTTAIHLTSWKYGLNDLYRRLWFNELIIQSTNYYYECFVCGCERAFVKNNTEACWKAFSSITYMVFFFRRFCCCLPFTTASEKRERVKRMILKSIILICSTALIAMKCSSFTRFSAVATEAAATTTLCYHSYLFLYHKYCLCFFLLRSSALCCFFLS